LYGSQPVGREVLIRLARHLGEGFKREDNIVTMILTRADIYILPAVDMGGFDVASEGTCTYKDHHLMNKEAGNMFKEKNSVGAEAVKMFMGRFNIKLALSLEGNGKFVRMPWDDVRDSDIDAEEVFNMMAKTYISSHPVMKKNTPPCDGTRILGRKVDNAFPIGMVKGGKLQPTMFVGSMLDYVWGKYNIPMISAHISCCNYPNSRNLVELYKENLTPILKFLELSYQGVWGKVTDSNSNPIRNVSINIGGKMEVTDKNGMYQAIYPEGKYKLELVHENYQTKAAQFTVEKSRMTRQDVVLDSLAPSLSYHTLVQIRTSLKSLVDQFPNSAKMYDHTDLECIKITESLSSTQKPIIRVLGWSMAGVEVSLALAQYLVTRVGKDDLVSFITDKYEVHVLFGKNITSSPTITTTCPVHPVVFDQALSKSLEIWVGRERGEIFGIDFVSGNGKVEGKGEEGERVGHLYKDMLVGDTSQCEPGQADYVQASDQGSGCEDHLVVGLSCCDKPSSLGSIWAAHSRAALTAISSLQGVHGELVNSEGKVVVGLNDKLMVNQSDVVMEMESGHFWLFLPVGQHTISVGKVTKLVTVLPSKLTMVKFEVEDLTGMSTLVVLCIMAVGLGLAFLVFSICRKRNRKGFKGSKVGFEKLADKSEVFTDSEEEDVEFDKTLAKLGLPPSKPLQGSTTYHDYSDGSESEEEDLLLTRP